MQPEWGFQGRNFPKISKFSNFQKFSLTTTYLGLLKTCLESLNKSKNLIMAIESIVGPSLHILKIFMFGNLVKIFAMDIPTYAKNAL